MGMCGVRCARARAYARVQPAAQDIPCRHTDIPKIPPERTPCHPRQMRQMELGWGSGGGGADGEWGGWRRDGRRETAVAAGGGGAGGAAAAPVRAPLLLLARSVRRRRKNNWVRRVGAVLRPARNCAGVRGGGLALQSARAPARTPAKPRACRGPQRNPTPGQRSCVVSVGRRGMCLCVWCVWVCPQTLAVVRHRGAVGRDPPSLPPGT